MDGGRGGGRETNSAAEGAQSITTGDQDMEIGISRAWASPSTLHLRLWIQVGKNGHLIFRQLAVPIEDIDGQVWTQTLAIDLEPEADQPLPGLL